MSVVTYLPLADKRLEKHMYPVINKGKGKYSFSAVVFLLNDVR
jgi:hypothetical protein